MATLAMGTGMARVIGVASIPFLTRIYSPEDYGVLAVYTALVAILAPVLTLRYVLAVPLPRNDGLAMNLLVLAAMLMFGTSLLIIGILWTFAPILLGWMSMDVLVPWWSLVVLGAVVTSIYECLSMWATRRRAYQIVAKTQISQSVFGEGAKLLLGILEFKPVGLLIGHLISQGGGVSSFLVRFRQDFKNNLVKINKRHILLIAWYYRDYPKYRLPSQFLLAISSHAPVMIAAALFDTKTTGQLGFALMALALPLNLIGQSLSSAFFAEIARLRKNSASKIKLISYAIQKRLFLIGIPIVIMLSFFGEIIFSWSFGEKWREAGKYASILSPYLVLQLTSAPLIQVLNLYNAQFYFLLINCVRLMGLIGIYLIIKIMNLDARDFVFCLGAFLSLFYLFVSILIFVFVRRKSDLQDKLKYSGVEK